MTGSEEFPACQGEVRRVSRPLSRRLGERYHVSTDADATAKTPEGVIVIRLDALLIFANVDAHHAHITELVEASVTHPRGVVLDLETVATIDTDGGDALRAIHHDLTVQGIGLAISRLKPART